MDNNTKLALQDIISAAEIEIKNIDENNSDLAHCHEMFEYIVDKVMSIIRDKDLHYYVEDGETIIVLD